jgi:ribonuclease HI
VGIAIFRDGEIEKKLKYKLNNDCTNNQAEQLAIVKAIEEINKTFISESTRNIATIYTDSRVTIQSLKNHRIHNKLIEEIRSKAITLERKGWNVKFKWIKAHDGNFGNELADKLAKEATKIGTYRTAKFQRAK